MRNLIQACSRPARFSISQYLMLGLVATLAPAHAQAQGFTATYMVGTTQVTLPATGAVPAMSFSNSLFSGVSQTVTLLPTGAPISVAVAVNNPATTPWLAVNPSGSIPLPALGSAPSGTPLTVSVNPMGLGSGTYTGSFQIQTVPAGSGGVTVFVTLMVNGGVSSGLVITSATPLPNANIDQAYQFALQASGGTGAGYVWSLSAGALPGNLQLSSSGNLSTPYLVVSGSVASGSTFTFSVQVQDSGGSVSSKQFTISVFGTGPPTIVTTSLPTAVVGQPYAVAVNEAGGQAPYSWSLSNSLPAGLTLNYSAGTAVTITGTPAVPGASTFTLRVTDNAGFSAAQVFTLSVGQTAGIVILSSVNPSSITTGSNPITIVANGSGFLPNATVLWNGASLATTFQSSQQLVAVVPASFIATAGTALVSVVVPGVGSSGAITVTVVANGLSIVTASPLPAAAVGMAYSQGLLASGGTTPYKGWTVVGGGLPPGLALTQVGGVLSGFAGPASVLLSGTPTAAGVYSFAVQITDGANANAVKQFSLTVTSGSISIAPNGIVNGASFAVANSTSGGVAPGEIVTIFGTGLGPAALATLQLDSRGYVSTALAGTQVMFSGFPAPIIYTSAMQVSAIVPYAVAGRVFTTVQVFYQGQLSNPETIAVTPTSPGIFTDNSSGQGQGAIINQDGTVNSPTNPALAGSVVFVYATGEGQTSPQGIDGKPGASPAPQPVAQPVTATVGGTSASVLYAGGVPGLVAGVLQVNVKIPPGTPSGSGVPVAIQVGGQSSQAGVTLAVR